MNILGKRQKKKKKNLAESHIISQYIVVPGSKIGLSRAQCHMHTSLRYLWSTNMGNHAQPGNLDRHRPQESCIGL